MLKIFCFLSCLFLTGCMVGPNYKEPVVPVVTHWKKTSTLVNEKSPRHPEWWKVFHDVTLTQLIQCGYANNVSLQAAGVNVLQARAQLAQSVGELYPQQQALTGNYTYNQIGGGSLQNLLPSEFQTDSYGFTANWEIDFWGKYRRAILSNNSNFLASIAAYDNALVTLTADIATAYMKIRTVQSQIKITDANIKVQKMGLHIASARYHAGQTSLIDVEQAKTELQETQSKLPPLRSQLQKQKDALSLLLGKPPNQLDTLLAEKNQGIPKAPLSTAVGIPRESLARRPDIHQARLQAMAQLELIGAAKANLFPAFSLSGNFGFSGNNINQSTVRDVFHWSNRTILAEAGFNWSILNYGQITNAVRQQDAVFQQALLNYINLTLKAQQEVQDTITEFIQAKAASGYLKKANRSATETLKLAFIRYKEGESDFTPVLNAEQQQLRIQSSLVNAEGDEPQALVALYRALGGGWEIRKGNDVIPDNIKKQMAARTNWGTLLKQQNHDIPRCKGKCLEQLYLPKW